MLAMLQTMLARGVRPGKPAEKAMSKEPESMDYESLSDGAAKPGVPATANAAPSVDKSGPAEQMLGFLGALSGSPLHQQVAEFVAVATQIGSADVVLAQARAASEEAEKSGDAKKWQEVALRTAAWSRLALEARQKNCLEKLREMVIASHGELKKEGKDVKEVKAAVPASAPKSLAWPAHDGKSHSVQDGWGGKSQHAEKVSSVGNSEQAGQLAPGLTARTTRKPNRQANSEGDGSMKKGLEALRDYQAEQVLIVRKIKKLGFESPMHLAKYFSKFGTVSKVHVANSMMRPSAKRPAGRIRPAALGFLVMEDAEAASAILAAGDQHQVGPAVIEVKAFEPFATLEEEEEDEA